MCICFFGFYWLKPAHFAEPRSTLNLSLRLQKLQTLTPQKTNFFFFQMLWQDGLSKKVALEYHLSLFYKKRWHFFFPKIWSYSLDEKRKMIYLKKNTWKYDIFFKCPEKMVFPKKSHWNMIFLVLSGKIVFFSGKYDIFSLGGKWKMIFHKKYMEIWYFLYICINVINMI